MKVIDKIRLDGFLSFSPDSPEIELSDLNVMIGPNGSGKSNLIEAIELLRATPNELSQAIRDGGGALEWIWKGDDSRETAGIDVVLSGTPPTPNSNNIRYRLEFGSQKNHTEVVDEAIEAAEPNPGFNDAYFYYRFQRGRPVLNVLDLDENRHRPRELVRADLAPDQSVLQQVREPTIYPEINWVRNQFLRFQTFREWTFGRYAKHRRLAEPDLPSGMLLPDASNLAHIVNQIETEGGRDKEFEDVLRKVLPQFRSLKTRLINGRIELVLFDAEMKKAIPPTRLSDGTIRLIAILAILLSPEPPGLVCIEEPELGLHPDAVTILADLLVDASQRMQLIVTTHSDTLVSALSHKPESIVTFERKGTTTVTRRLDRKELGEWLEEYELGTLWQMGHLGANP